MPLHPDMSCPGHLSIAFKLPQIPVNYFPGPSNESWCLQVTDSQVRVLCVLKTARMLNEFPRKIYILFSSFLWLGSGTAYSGSFLTSLLWLMNPSRAGATALFLNLSGMAAIMAISEYAQGCSGQDSLGSSLAETLPFCCQKYIHTYIFIRIFVDL